MGRNYVDYLDFEKRRDEELAFHYLYVSGAAEESIKTGLENRYSPPPKAVLEGVKLIFQYAVCASHDKTLKIRNSIPLLGLGNHYQLLSRILKEVEPNLKKETSLDARINELSLALNGLTLSDFQINPTDAKSLRNIFNRIVNIGKRYTPSDSMDDDGDSSPPGTII
jgi:hypothetical protein